MILILTVTVMRTILTLTTIIIIITINIVKNWKIEVKDVVIQF